MKYVGRTFEARHPSELDNMVRKLSTDGYRIVTVINRSSRYDDRFLIIAQKEVDAQITVSGPSEDIRFGTNDR